MLAEALDQACRPWLHRLDPRVRVCFAITFAFLVALVSALHVAAAALAVGVVAYLASGLPPRVLLKRLAPLNVMLSVLALLLIAPQLALVDGAWTLRDTQPVLRVGLLFLKANAIMLIVTVFFSTIPPIILGHSLERLGFPRKLTRLLLFTVRYLDVMHHEFRRLRYAMRVRGFVPRANYHTVRSYANLVGMLLVRALDRAERIEDAMACRGFTGHFPVAHALRFQARDSRFAVLLCLLALLILLMEGLTWR